MFPPNGQKMQLLLWKHAQLNSLHLLLKLWQPKKWWFQHFSDTLLCKKKPGPSSWASPQRIKATFIAVVLPIKQYLSSTCLNMHQHAIPAQNFILFLSCTSFQNRRIWTCSWATSLPQSLPRKVWMHMGPATKRARFVRPEASWSECVVLLDYGDFHQRWKMKTFFSKVALKVSCLQVLDVLTWKLLLACERQTACSSRK